MRIGLDGQISPSRTTPVTSALRGRGWTAHLMGEQMGETDGVAAAWDAEYGAGRYRGEPPVAFTEDILGAARVSGLPRGLSLGCGTGRNYLPLVAGGLDLTGLDISATAIAQLAVRAPGGRPDL